MGWVAPRCWTQPAMARGLSLSTHPGSNTGPRSSEDPTYEHGSPTYEHGAPSHEHGTPVMRGPSGPPRAPWLSRGHPGVPQESQKFFSITHIPPLPDPQEPDGDPGVAGTQENDHGSALPQRHPV